MNSILENVFTINGIKSWIHCLEQKVDKTSAETPLIYHYHDYIELLYAVNADGYVWCNGEAIRFKTGNLVIVNSNMPHELTHERYSEYICVKFSPSVLYADETSLFEYKYIMPFLYNNTHQKVFGNNDIDHISMKELFVNIMEEWNTKEPGYELIIRANILRLLAGIFRYWNKNENNNITITDTIKTALLYIEEHFENITEAEVAEYCHVSYNHFSFLFKNAIGKSFSEYINFLRISKAEKLLLSSEKSITDIALETGFSTSSYFISKFKAYKGLTPKQFRKNIEKI